MPFLSEAMEGLQGRTRFFNASMRWGELQQLAVFPDELRREFDSDEDRLQRGMVRSRIAPLVRYLVDVPDHFFSALTLIILPRSLEAPAIEASTLEDENWDYYFERGTRQVPGRVRVGLIHLSANVQLFPADGQHRLRAALDAIEEDPSIAREEVPVVLIPYQTRGQVGQLFSDLNLNAKPVNKTVGYSLESRDPVVLIAKRVMAELPLFQGRVHLRSNSLPRSSANVITMSGLVEGTRTLLCACLPVSESISGAQKGGRDGRAHAEHWAKHQPQEAFELVRSMWATVVGAFELQWRPVLEGVHGAAGALRDQFVFPHGLGWSALTAAAAELRLKHGDGWERLFRHAVASIEWGRANPAWEECATARGAVMNTAQNVRATTQFVVAAGTQ